MLTTLLLLATLAQPAQAQPAAAVDFTAAKRMADADESSITGKAHQAMLDKLKATADAAIADCSGQGLGEDFTAFVVVMQLDGTGRVQHTWRQGSSPLALCLQRHVRDKTVFVPPKAPFHTALEISFTK